MAPSPTASRLCPPILAVGLLTASAAAGIAGGWAARADVGALIAQRIAGARGAMSPENVAALQAVDFRLWLWGAAAALAVAAWIAWRTGPRWHGQLATTAEPLGGVALMVLCTVAVLARWPLTLTEGFFRYDDFDLLSIAQEHPWWRAIWLPHGDHVFPLTRVPAAIGLALFGTTAWPYNLGVLACMISMMTMGGLLLRAWGAGRAAQLFLVALTVGWSPWGELMAGYYILSSYTLIAACGLAVAWAWLRWREARRSRFAWLAALALLTATLIDISGWYVPGVFGVFLAADFLGLEKPRSLRAWLVAHRTMIGGVVLATAAGLACMVYAYAVVNRGLFLSMGGGQGRSLLRLAADFAYLIDVGLLVSMAVPYVYARLPVAVLGVLAAGAFVAAVLFLGRALARATRPQRLALGAGAAVVAGIALMVALGRPSESTLAVRWAAKHVGPAYVWLCLLLVFAWHILWVRADARRRALLAEITVALLLGFGVAQTAIGRLGLAVAFPPFGYAAEIRDARVRRAALDELRTQLLPAIQRARGNEPITVPTLDGSYLGERWPSLFDYNLATYAPFFGDSLRGIALVRTAAMHPWPAPGAATVPSLRAVVSPAFRAALPRDEILRRFYLGRMALRTHPAAADALPALPLPSGDFDPEAQPRWLFSAAGPAAGTEVRAVLAFTSDFGRHEAAATVVLRAGEHAEADLRQIVAFALSRRISDVSLRVESPADARVTIAPLPAR
ncbi:MAG: hypothetical protein JNL39_06330 [Opitutaceae bacterium]|nr:hypothetical protein [Opitutaceae bacterium]